MLEHYITSLKLEKHIEGGYFRQIYKSTDQVKPLNSRYNKLDESPEVERSAGTSIYFLLNGNDFSAWHSVQSDEIWHYYDGGSPLYIHAIDEHGDLKTYLLGNPRLTPESSFQVVIKAGWWFAAEVVDKRSFGLVGCTVSPGFEYPDFILANKKDLTQQFPRYTKVISRLTRSENIEDQHEQEATVWRKSLVKSGFFAAVTGLLFYTTYKILTHNPNGTTPSLDPLPKPQFK